MATWNRLVSGSTAGNVSLNIDYAIQSVTRTSNTNVRVVYGIRFSMATSTWTYNSIAAFTPAGGTRRYAFNSSSGSYHTNSGTYYYANTSGSTTTSETCPFTIDIPVSLTQTSASFEVGYGWDAYTPNQKGSSSITVNFPTGATAPTGLSCSVSNVTETGCKLSGSYSSDGGATVTSTGYQYKIDGGSWTNCTSSLTGLTPGRKYYFRYYATNSQGTSYSDGSTNTTTYEYPHLTSTPNFTIGTYPTVKLYNPLKRSCTIYLKGADNSVIYTGIRAVDGNTQLYPDSSEIQAMYSSIPNNKSGTYKVRLVCSAVSYDTTITGGTYSIKDDGTEVPNFSDSNWSYSADKTNLTNTNQCIIKGYSTVTFTVNTAATSSYGATIVKYVYKWGSQSKDSTSGNTVTGGTNNVLQVDAVDSRGLIKSTQKTLTSGDKYVPYNLPSLDYSNSYTHRTDGISNETKLTLRGNLSVMKFGNSGVANAIYSVKYKVYDYSTGQWTSEFTIPVSSFTLQSSGYFSLSNYLIHANGSSGGFTIGKRYAVQIILKDAGGNLGTLNSSNILVTDGKIARDVYQDSNGNYHQGINGMGNDNYTEVIYGDENIEGDLYINGNKKLSNTQIDKTLYVGDTGKQLKDIKINSDNIDAALLHRGTVGNLDSLYNAGLYRYANDNSKATTPFQKFNFGQVLVIPYRKGSGNTKTDYTVQLFFGDADVAGYGGQIYYRFGFSNGWGNWYALHTKMEYGSVERPTGEVIDGKQIFTKTVKFTDTIAGGTVYNKAHGISDATRIWIDLSNSYFRATNGVTLPVPSITYYGNMSDRIGIQVNGGNIAIYTDTNWGNTWEKVITLKYIK